ncbi:type II toxin-antitoxin system RelE/ParE family toxin [Sphingomonas koreensis]|nr:type II toxin-antitoxin system RelE/ParE family toxin [Sphingomonas koreensis]
MRAIKWSRSAQIDIAGIDDFYHTLNPGFARRVGLETINAAKLLADRPELGQIVPDSPYRKWRVGKTPYLVFYRFDANTFRIVRIVHAARDWRSLL